MASDGKDAATVPPVAEDGASKDVTSEQASDSSSSSSRARPVPEATEAPLPYDEQPPLPDEPVPDANDDGWSCHWDDNAKAYYFYNRLTGVYTWENPRISDATVNAHAPYDRTLAGSTAPGTATSTTAGAPGTTSPSKPTKVWGGYNPKIHGSYDPNADYAQEAKREEEEAEASVAALGTTSTLNGQDYSAVAQFNRFTGKFQQDGMGPEMHNDENKSKRQMNAFFDVDAAANSHDGRSLREERRNKPISKKQLKEFKEKRHKKKEDKRRAWLTS